MTVVSTRRGFDGYVLEHILKPHFWILCILLFTFCIASMSLAYRDQTTTPPNSESSKKPKASNGLSRPPPDLTLWLNSYLTTGLRKTVALIAYIVIFGTQLHIGNSICVTLYRIIENMVTRLPVKINWVFGVHICSILVLLVMGLAVLGILVFMIIFQLSCIGELSLLFGSEEGWKGYLRRREQRGLKSKKEIVEQKGGEDRR